MNSSFIRRSLGLGLLVAISTAFLFGISAPVATTLAPKNITSTSATLQGKIEPGGMITNLYFISCDPTSSPSFFLQTPTRQTSGTTAKSVSFTLTGLKPGTAYKYAVTAMNDKGKHTGGCVSFTTLRAGAGQAAGAAPTVDTLAATEVTSTTATLNGTVNPNGLATEVRFKSCSGSSAPEYFALTAERDIGSGRTAQSVGYRLSGLTPGKTYKYAVRAYNSAGDKVGDCVSFTTGAAQATGKPVVETRPAINVGPTSATLCGSVNPKGLATTYSFVSGETNKGDPAYFPKTSERQAGSSSADLNVTTQIDGLQPNTRYEFRIQAKNSAGTDVGQSLSFKTGAATGSSPTVRTNDATSVGSTTATLSATVNPNGDATNWQFVSCDAATAPGFFNAAPQPRANLGSGTTSSPIYHNLTGLKPDTTYRFAIYAQNSKGSKKGDCKTFKTLPAGATMPIVTTLSAHDVRTTSFWVRANVNPSALETTVWFEACGIDKNSVTYFPSTTREILLAGTTVKSVTAYVFQLFPGVVYSYRVMAKNSLYTAIGDCVNVTTLAPEAGKVYVQTLPPTQIERSYAMLHGVVNPNRMSCQVNFVCDSPSVGKFNPTTKNDRTGTGTQSVDYRVTGLNPGTTYVYRIQATDGSGKVVSGQQITFKTPE